MGNEVDSLIGFNEFVVDTKKKVLWFEDEPVELPLKAVELLCVLIEKGGEVVSKDELLDRVWSESFVEEGVLSQNVYQLRKIFKEFGNQKDLIQTIPRRGYRFLGEITEIIEQEISIERKTTEKKLVTESIITDEETENLGMDLHLSSDNVGFEKNTQNLSPFIINKGFIVYLLIGFFSVSVIGAMFWFWKPMNAEGKKVKLFTNPELVKFLRLTDSGKAFFPAISRDNQNLAYVKAVDGKWSIVLRHISTKSEMVVVKPQEHELMSINFSADDNYIFYASRGSEDRGSTIYKIPLYGGAKQKIITWVRHQFSISRDGKKLAFFRYDPKENSVSSLMTANSDGTGEKIIARGRINEYFRVWGTFPDWSSDDKRIMVSVAAKASEKGTKVEKSYFLEIDVETGKKTFVKHPNWEGVYQAFWLNDGSGYIVSAREDRSQPTQLWHLEQKSGKATRITNDTNDYSQFRISFDTESIAIANQKKPADIFLVDLEHPNPNQIKQLTNETNRSNGHYGLTWSKDGKHLMYVKSEGYSNGELWKIDVETKEQHQLTFDKETSVGKIEMMPDGKSMLFDSNRTGDWHIWKIDTDGRNLRQFSKKDGIGNPEVTSDAKWLLYSTAGSPREVWKQPLNGGEAIKVLSNASIVVKSSPTDSSQVIAGYYDPDAIGDPWKCVLFSHEKRGIKKDLGFVRIQPTFDWSTDGTGIYFPKINSLWYLSLKDEKLREIIKLRDLRIVNLSVSPDGKTLAIAGEKRTSNILRIKGF